MPKMLPASYIRAVNAAPGCKKVDIYTNGYCIGKKLSFKKCTPYIRVPPGHHNTVIYMDKSSSTPQVSNSIDLEEGLIYTAAASGSSPVELFIIPDPKVPLQPHGANVRFVNLCQGEFCLTVAYSDGNTLWEEIGYKHITDYITLLPGSCSFIVKTNGSDAPLFTMPRVLLSEKCSYTFYAMGIKGGSPGPQGMLLMDGGSYIREPENNH